MTRVAQDLEVMEGTPVLESGSAYGGREGERKDRRIAGIDIQRRAVCRDEYLASERFAYEHDRGCCVSWMETIRLVSVSLAGMVEMCGDAVAPQ